MPRARRGMLRGSPKTSPYGLRLDGTPKGKGFLGLIPMADGKHDFMSEQSVGVNFDGREIQIPTIVPSLTRDEIEYLRQGGDPRKNPVIFNKAIRYAIERMRRGQSPFLEKNEWFDY